MAGLQLLGKTDNKPLNLKTLAAVQYSTERML